MSDESNDNNELKAQLRAIRDKIRVTKVVATRSVKGRNGDSFAGFSAGWQSIQDDYGGPGADAMAEPAEDAAYAAQGMTLKEARVAHYMIAMTADVAALESAHANGSISGKYFADATAGVKNQYGRMIQKVLGHKSSDGDKSES
jgi:hypothetical protein